MWKESGITLIALVITIIVLLILAGVTIAMLTGQNGILTRASQSSVANALGAAEDKVGLDISAAVSDYYKTIYVDRNTAGGSNVYSQASLDSFIESEVKKHSTTLKKLMSMLEDKSNEW